MLRVIRLLFATYCYVFHVRASVPAAVAPALRRINYTIDKWYARYTRRNYYCCTTSAALDIFEDIQPYTEI